MEDILPYPDETDYSDVPHYPYYSMYMGIGTGYLLLWTTSHLLCQY